MDVAVHLQITSFVLWSPFPSQRSGGFFPLSRDFWLSHRRYSNPILFVSFIITTPSSESSFTTPTVTLLEIHFNWMLTTYSDMYMELPLTTFTTILLFNSRHAPAGKHFRASRDCDRRHLRSFTLCGDPSFCYVWPIIIACCSLRFIFGLFLPDFA